jgi:two-component system phosphate regulon response regulator PhoB
VFPLVFLIENDVSISNLLRSLLEVNQYAVCTFPLSADVVISAGKERRPALFLIGGPLGDSLTLCRTIRQNSRLEQTPVVIMSGRDSEEDRIRGFESGADDFVTKPLRPRELVARINALMRRCHHQHAAARVEAGGIEVDTEHFVLSVRGKKMHATATQARLVEYLMRNEGRVLSRDQILDAVWSDSCFVTPRTIDVHIRRIRKLIELNPAKPKHLKTVRGGGYCFSGHRDARDPIPAAEWLSSSIGPNPLPVSIPPARLSRAS